MSYNNQGTVSGRMGDYLSQQTTATVINTTSTMAAGALINYAFNAANNAIEAHNQNDAGNIQSNDLAIKALSMFISMVIYGFCKDYIQNTVDYFLNPIFGHNQSHPEEASLEFISPDLNEDTAIKINLAGEEFVAAH